MTWTLGRGLGIGMVVLALVGAGLPEVTAARRVRLPKQVVKAKIAGKKFKAKKANVVAVWQPSLDTLTITAFLEKIRPARGLIRNLTLIATVDLETVAFPVTVPVFTASYSLINFKGFGTTFDGVWAGEDVVVTLTSFDGTRLKGTFTGTLDPASGSATEVAAVEKGKFSVVIANPLP